MPMKIKATFLGCFWGLFGVGFGAVLLLNGYGFAGEVRVIGFWGVFKVPLVV